MSKFLDMMLRPEITSVQKELPHAQYEVKRLSSLVGEPVILELHGLPYHKAQEVKETETDQEVLALLAGCPELRNPALANKFGGVTPAETVKAMLLPGEIADLSRAVERLTGYRQLTIQEVKNE